MNTSYKRKAIEVVVTLGSGTFAGKGNQKTIRGLGTDVSIEKAGPPDKNKCTVKIYNMLYEEMEQLTTLAFRPLEKRKNLITVSAGDDDKSSLPMAFSGEIVSSFADFNNAPDIVMQFNAMSGSYPALIAKNPMSVKGNAPVADIISALAKQCGYSFKNEGVTASLRNSVLNGSPLQQAHQAAEEAGAELLVDDNQMILLPTAGARQGNAIQLNDKTGMFGYPTFTNTGINVRSMYNENYKYAGLIEVSSIVPKASGIWRITKLTHNLSAFRPGGGPWESSLEAAPINSKQTNKK